MTPTVRVVVLNFDGGQMTLDCLDSIRATEWPPDRLDVVLVDNGSLDDVAERVRAERPEVTVLEPLANLGFAGGCNLGMRAPGDYDFVALLNNDAVADPGWIRALVDAAGDDPRAGAINAKLLFDGRYHDVRVEVSGAARHGGDPRLLGVRVSGARLDGRRIDDRLVFDEGFYGAEPPHLPDAEEIARWSSARGSVRVRSDGSTPSTLSLRLSALGPRTVKLESGGCTTEVEVGPVAVWADVALDPEVVDIVNNAGSNLYAGGFGGDRGFLEVDRGQYEERADVFAWCGGAVLLRRAYLDEVGMFDESLFLYYEDTELSWRGRLRGWHYLYEPRAVVRHRHAVSSGVGSPTFRYYTERNRLLVLARHAPARLALRSGAGELRRFVAAHVRHYVLRPLTLRLPVRAEVAHRRRVFYGYVRLLPRMLAARWAPGRTVSRRSLMSWMVEKW